LPCRRSWVRILSAALEKTCICRSFSLRQSPCSSASGRTDSGLAVRRLSAASRKNAPFAGRFSFVRTEVILQACRRSSVPPAAGVGWLFLQTARSCARTPADAPPVVPILGGESDFSPDTVRSTLARTATSASHGSHRRELSAGRRPRQRRGARHGRPGPWQSLGIHRRGRRLHRKRASARNRAGLLLTVQGRRFRQRSGDARPSR
jgi:hypothetical protein